MRCLFNHQYDKLCFKTVAGKYHHMNFNRLSNMFTEVCQDGSWISAFRESHLHSLFLERFLESNCDLRKELYGTKLFTL